jgi:hypothetical protein
MTHETMGQKHEEQNEQDTVLQNVPDNVEELYVHGSPEAALTDTPAAPPI